MKFLNGLKTAIGLIGTFATPLIAVGGKVGDIVQHGVNALPAAYQMAEGAFLMLTALGIIHKVEKANTPKV